MGDETNSGKIGKSYNLSYSSTWIMVGVGFGGVHNSNYSSAGIYLFGLVILLTFSLFIPIQVQIPDQSWNHIIYYSWCGVQIRG